MLKNKSSAHFFCLLFLIHALILTLSAFLFRLYLMVSLPYAGFESMIYSLGWAFVFDFAVAIYTFLPLAAVISMATSKMSRSKGFNWIVTFLLSANAFICFFNLTSEYFFFQEFKDRFNFIAVDYLVYTQEVLNNIWESYPLVSIILVITVLVVALGLWLRKKLFSYQLTYAPKFSERVALLGSYAVVFIFCSYFVNEQIVLSKANAIETIISKNGFHSLFAAYRNNEINFDQFYSTMSSKDAASIVHDALENSHDEKNEDLKKEDEFSIIRNIKPLGLPRKLNVIVVLMESLSAKFLGSYGNTENITPNLDLLAHQGLFFKSMFSTGTRTVRGIEATMLSIPPTPGQSIVRRPGGTGIFNLGSVFEEQGYENKFIYGGRSFFDNMGPFFEGNGFEVIDHSSFRKDEISFSNAWGVADEDLFNKVISESDKSFRQGRHFFNFVLTTSNHRPYTFPENKIDLPSGGGRSAAVKYSDYAIGQFIRSAKSKSWFSDTVFVFISDHNASVGGSENIQPQDYLIPLIIYSPKYLKAEVNTIFSSQIDMAPTLLGLLNFPYQSRFFGRNLLEENSQEFVQRAFIATYQKVGYLTPDKLIILSPNQKIDFLDVASGVATLKKSEKRSLMTKELPLNEQLTVAYYKTASDWFNLHLLDNSKKFSTLINLRR